MFGVTHGALQFMTYEEMKNYYNQYRRTPIDTKLCTHEYLFFAAISKLIAAATTYPYQVSSYLTSYTQELFSDV